MFSKDSCHFVCELGLMLSSSMFEMGFTGHVVWLGDWNFVGFLLGEAMNLS